MSVSVGMGDYERFRAWAAQADRKIAAAHRKKLREIGREMGREVIAEGAEGMPSSGGLQAHLAGGKAGLQLLAAGIRLRLGSKGAGIGPIDRTGLVRHPTYGHKTKRAWVTQAVEPGTWTKAFEARAQDARAQVATEIQSVLREAKSL